MQTISMHTVESYARRTVAHAVLVSENDKELQKFCLQAVSEMSMCPSGHVETVFGDGALDQGVVSHSFAGKLKFLCEGAVNANTSCTIVVSVSLRQ